MPCPGCLEGCALERVVPLAEQPASTEATADGVFTKTFVLPLAGSIVPQHAHADDHLTLVVRGSIRVWVNGRLDQDYRAMQAVLIPAHDLHHFMTLEPDTTLVCVHDVSEGRTMRMVAENALPGVA